MSDELAISVHSVSKNFKLPHQKANSVKSLAVNPFRSGRNYEVQHALKNINLEIKKGEFFGIVGRNGSGKSTLLKILAGIYQPTKGSVQIHGKLVPFIELGVGFNPELTGRENVYLNGALLGFSEKEVAAMYDDIVEFAELEKFMDQKLKNYSSGMQVRLAFSMATRSQADILLIDEVLAVGDADFQRKCFNYFKILKKMNKTVILVSHDMDSIREYCDKAALIEQNELVTIGRSEEIATAYTKLFTKKISGVSNDGDDQDKRWGDKSVIINKLRLSKNKLTDDDKTLIISAELSTKTDSEGLMTGFIIRNQTGTPVLGTNSRILQTKLDIRGGQSRTVSWTIPNVFSEGRHDITLAVENRAQVADWWEEALSFDVVLERKTPYIVSPAVTIDITKETS